MGRPVGSRNKKRGPVPIRKKVYAVMQKTRSGGTPKAVIETHSETIEAPSKKHRIFMIWWSSIGMLRRSKMSKAYEALKKYDAHKG